MSQYAELEDMVLGLQATALTDVDEDTQVAHIVAASALADSYISSRGYTVPLTTWGQDLRGAVVRIAAWTLINARGVNPNHAGHIALMKAHDDSIAWLRDVAKGVANIDVATTTPARANTGVIGVYTPDAGEELRGW